MGLITNLFTAGGGSRIWCRPTHRATACFAIQGTNACCVCIPSTATCFVIEMWGQGGGGAGGCCCSGSPFGGQGGSYGWAVCTTAGTNHILCVCVCSCDCCNSGGMGWFAGSGGQISRVCNCTTGWLWQTDNACGGSTCCWYDQNACVWPWDWNSQYSPLSFACCWDCFYNGLFDCQRQWCHDRPDCRNYFERNTAFCFRQGTSYTGCTYNCCQCFNFFVKGACGFSNPAQFVAFGVDHPRGGGKDNKTTAGNGYGNAGAAYCHAAFGNGGMAYAGGGAQCCDCGMFAAQGSCNNCCNCMIMCWNYGGVNGNTPGGGGKSAGGSGLGGGCCLGSCGGRGLVLISYS